MRILVTGANGYLGQGIVKQLLDLGVEVIATDINTNNIDKRAKIYACDLFNINDPYNYFNKPDSLLHLAWKDGFIHNSNAHIIELPNHYLFINELIQSGIKNISIMGTMHEIGYYEGKVSENTPCNPISNYGISKNTLRILTKLLCEQKKVNYKWLRSYYIIGNTKHGNSIFSKILEAEEKGMEKFPFTTGTNKYDFLEYNEFVKMVSYTVIQNNVNGLINICNGIPEQLSYKVEEFIERNNLKIRLDYGVYPDRPYDSKSIWGDNKEIRAIIREKHEKNN